MPRPQDPPATQANPRWVHPIPTEGRQGLCFGGRLANFPRVEFVQRLDDPMQPQFSMDPSGQAPPAFATRLGDFKHSFSALARSPSYHAGPPPECLVRRTLSPLHLSHLLLSCCLASFVCPLSLANLAIALEAVLSTGLGGCCSVAIN